MMTFVNVTIDQWNRLGRADAKGPILARFWGLLRLLAHPSPLDGVGGWVFTRDIEHTFENRVVLMVQEVLL
jgi:hypothetical protein